jgi:hypothetical protein
MSRIVIVILIYIRHKPIDLAGEFPGKGFEPGYCFTSPLFWSQDCRLQRGLVVCRLSIVVFKALVTTLCER